MTAPEVATAPFVQISDGTNPVGTVAHPLVVSGTIDVDTTALATAAKQDTGNTSLATIATNTTGNLPTKVGASASVDAGANINLNDTNSHRAASLATSLGYATFSAPLANTAPIYLGRATGVTTSTGIELLPGQSKDLPCANTNEWWAVTGTATQACHVVAE